MSFEGMVSFLDAAYPARGFLVPCLRGPSGIGKTAAVNVHAEHVGAGKVVTIILSQVLPNEVSGITMPVLENKAMEIFDHFRLSSLEDGDILFLDELLEADQLVLSACLTLIESRQMMSGRLLPDIQIVAATNETVKPMMLKENIRQRFLWREFGIDAAETRRYIKETCGFDPGDKLVRKLQNSGQEYNILTPRSLTKMCQWIAASDGDFSVAEQIDACWESSIGTELRLAYLKSETKEKQVRRAIEQATLSVLGESSIDFQNTNMKELIELLESLSEWEEIETQLKDKTVEEKGVSF